MLDAPYYDADRLVAEAFAAAFLPPEPVNVAEWATQKRWLANEGGGYVGRWRHDIAPYLREPMEVLTDTTFLTEVIVGPGQCGKTEIGLNWLGASIDSQPADFLWYMQTQTGMEAFAKSRIDPMIDDHEVLSRKRGGHDSLSYKQFTGMKGEFLPATRSALINKSAPRIVADEWDAYDPSIGDPKTLLDIRRQTFGRESKLLAMSHCDRADGLRPHLWRAGIMKLYSESDRRIWYWQCPECEAWSSPHPLAARVMVLDYPEKAPLDEIVDAARLICPVNGCILDDAARKQMNLTGRWIGLGQAMDQDGTIEGVLTPRDTAGFWIVGLMSPFLLKGMGGLAANRASAEREKETTGSDKTLKEVIVKEWGLPYDPPRTVGSIDANTLADRADPLLILGQVPDGVRFLTGFADIQVNRAETLIRGWGERGESWVLEHRVHLGAPATDPAFWDRLLTWLAETTWPLADGSGRAMRLRSAGFDSAGEPGVTQQAYDAWRRALAAKRTRRLGMFDGREAWTLIGTKGADTRNAPPLQITRPDSARKDRRARASGTVPIALFGANAFKDNLAGQLGRGEPGPWYVHFPAGLRTDPPPHVWFEQLVAEARQANGTWIKTAPRNEALDLMVGTHVVAHLTGLAGIKWDRPPPWAQAWDTNTNIVAYTPDAPPRPMTTVPAAPPTGAQPVAGGNVASRLDQLANLLRG